MVKNRAGITLMEMLITVAIVGGVAMIAPQVINQSTKVFILARTKMQLQREARAAMYLLTREIRQAQSNSIIIDQANGQPYYSRISFTKAQNVNVIIRQNGTQLLLTEGNTTTTLTSNLAYLAFTFPESDDLTIISVSMTLQEQIYGGTFKALHMASERVRVMD
jgi:prepilin-type N-terminal cleavage/methylation domain-containing protein